MSNQIKFILFLLITGTIGQMAAEVYIPSLPYIGHDFKVGHRLTQISIAVFLLGMAIPGVIFGYISDYFGRRKILLYTTSISSIGSLLCLIAPNIYVLIFGRFVQGLGFSGVGSISKAVMRDRLSGLALARFASYFSMMFALVIDLSPFIGGFLQEWFGWRAIFALLFIYNLLALYVSYRFKESTSLKLNSKLSFAELSIIIKKACKNRIFIKYNIISSITYSILMAYLAVASFLFQEVLNLTPSQFGTTTLALSFIYILGAFVNAKLLKYCTITRLLKNAVIFMWIAAILLVLYGTILKLNYFTMLILVSIIYIASSSLFSNSSALVFMNIRNNVGTLSALYNSIQVIMGAIATIIISFFKPTTTLPLAILIIILCMVLTILMWFVKTPDYVAES